MNYFKIHKHAYETIKILLKLQTWFSTNVCKPASEAITQMCDFHLNLLSLKIQESIISTSQKLQPIQQMNFWICHSLLLNVKMLLKLSLKCAISIWILSMRKFKNVTYPQPKTFKWYVSYTQLINWLFHGKHASATVKMFPKLSLCFSRMNELPKIKRRAKGHSKRRWNVSAS